MIFQWQISELEQKKMEDVNYSNTLFHFCDEVADRIEEWLKSIGVLNLNCFEDCRTNHFFYIVNNVLVYLNTDNEKEICYILANGFTVIEITEDKVNG